jgi:hypothetical protein
LPTQAYDVFLHTDSEGAGKPSAARLFCRGLQETSTLHRALAFRRDIGCLRGATSFQAVVALFERTTLRFREKPQHNQELQCHHLRRNRFVSLFFIPNSGIRGPNRNFVKSKGWK